MIHYHGTPITPREQMLRMAGRHFCISFTDPRDLEAALRIGQSVMFDNGAFSAFTRGTIFDPFAYYKWLEPILTPPHWAVIPDVIDGSLEDQYRMRGTWPELFGYKNAAAVFHIHHPLTELYYLCNAYPRVCLGSSGDYWNVGSPNWVIRMDEIFDFLVKKFNPLPFIHGLRMLGQLGGGWPLASADSTNLAQNFKIRTGCAECMAELIDGKQPAPISVMKERIENAQRQERLFA